MVKTKVIQAVVFSGLLFLLIILGSLYASGHVGGKDYINGNELTAEGKLGAGLISVAILVWLWAAAVFATPFMKWKGKSNFLTVLFILVFVCPIVTFVAGIVYVSMGKHKEEEITVKEKEVIE